MADSLKQPYLRKVDGRGDIEVWIVDGSYVRGHIDEEFTNFGQHYRYAYIPENEFWIDEEAEHDERTFFTDHLLVEHQLMTKGMPYEKALVEADKAERKERRRAGDVAKATHRGQQLPDGSAAHERLWKKLENGVSQPSLRFVPAARSIADLKGLAVDYGRHFRLTTTGAPV
jgi:hypothetical protein